MKKYMMIALFIPTILAASQFVVKKEKKQKACQAKEGCYNSFSATLKMSPGLLKSVAELQDVSMELLESMIEDSFFAKASKDELQKNAQSYEAFHARQEKIDGLMQEQLAFVREQKKKYIKS